jgi:hypothetical protein
MIKKKNYPNKKQFESMMTKEDRKSTSQSKMTNIRYNNFEIHSQNICNFKWVKKIFVWLTFPQPWVVQRWGRDVSASGPPLKFLESSSDEAGKAALLDTVRSPYFFQ